MKSLMTRSTVLLNCALASVLAMATHAAVGATVTEVGNPVFSVVDVALFSVQVAGPSGEDLFPSIEQALQPNYERYVSTSLGLPFLLPAVPHQPPYDAELSGRVAAVGGVPGSVFEPEDLRFPSGIMLVHTIVPGDGAPIGQSFDFANGPVLPLEIYPLTTTLQIRLNNGAAIPGGPFRSYSLQEIGLATNAAGNSVDLSALRESHAHGVFLPFVAPPFVPDADLLGDYEWSFSVRDAQGNGWDVAAPFTVVPEPSSLASMLSAFVMAGQRIRTRPNVQKSRR